MFDPLSLKYFGVVARERSVNRAARVLHASQPAVSRRIKQLEHEAGASLFERKSTGVSLTPAGRALARYADEIRRLTDEAGHVVRRVSGEPAKAVRIGFIQPTAIVLVPLLHLLQIEHPEIEVAPIEGTQKTILASLGKSEIDLALPGFVRSDLMHGLEGMKICCPVMTCIIPEQHKFAHRKQLHLAELCDEEFVSLDEHEFPGYYSLLVEQSRLAGFTPQISAFAKSWSEGIALIAAGRGVAIAPRSAITYSLGAAIKVIKSDVHLDWFALWNAGNGNPQLRIVIQSLLNSGPPGWSSIKRALPALGSSRINLRP